MKTKILIGLTLSTMLFVGCGDKPKEEQKIVESTPVVADAKSETVAPAANTSEAKSSDAAATYGSNCSSCHGEKGEGKSIFPKLAGQSKDELAKKLNGYKDGSYGKDKKAMMIPKAQNLNSDEIEQLAEVISKF